MPTENYYSTVYPMTVNLHKGPSPTVRKAKLCLWRKYILRAEGGISCALPWKCSPLTQIRREQKNAWSSSTCLLYVFSPQKRTSSTSKHENSVLFSIFVGHFSPPGSGSGSAIWMRIRIQQLKLMRIHVDPCGSGSGSETLVRGSETCSQLSMGGGGGVGAF